MKKEYVIPASELFNFETEGFIANVSPGSVSTEDVHGNERQVTMQMGSFSVRGSDIATKKKGWGSSPWDEEE